MVKANEESAPIRSNSTLDASFKRNHDTNAATTRIGWIPQANFSFICLPQSNFTYSWTLSSKFFSTFPHGTCPLSDSWQYLALDGVYHPFWAAFPNNSTPRTTPRHWTVSLLRALHPLWAWATIRWTWSGLYQHRKSDLNTTVPSNQSYRIRCWAFPPSLAVTRGIPVGFFSSA